MEKRSNDPVKSYTYWAGDKPAKGIQVIHGRYWQSGHFSKEYVVYLELATPALWKQRFINQNHLVKSADYMVLPDDAPAWFRYKKTFKTWEQPGGVDSRYFEDTQTGHFFIYEGQL